MKRILSLMVLLSIVSSQGFSSALRADDEVVIPNPPDILREKYDPTPSAATVKGEARYWADDFPFGGSVISRNNEDRSRVICGSVTDVQCAPTPGSSLQFSSALGVCESANDLACIEGFSLSTDVLAKENLTLISGGETMIAEVRDKGIPRGAHMSVWQATDGSRYALIPVVSGFLGKASTGWGPATAAKFSVNVFRVQSTFTAVRPTIGIVVFDGIYGMTCQSCRPTTVLEPAAGSRFEVNVRLPNTVSSWFQGRIANALIGAVSVDAERTAYTISGNPARVQVAGGFASSDNPNFPETRDATNTSRLKVTGSSPSSMMQYTTWKPFLNDTALMTRSEWSVQAFENYSTKGQSCLSGSTGAVGIAATNAAFYSPTPPAINPTTGLFEYVVASPHFDENSQVAVGSYSFGVPLSVLQCFLGSAVEPTAARVSLAYDNGVSPYTVTQDVTVQNGWVNVSISGFHFSKPKLKVGFLWRDSKGRLVALPSAVKKGKVKVKSRFAVTALARPSARSKPKWTATGACKLKSGTVITTKRGKCIVTLKVRNSSGRYYTKLSKSIKVV